MATFWQHFGNIMEIKIKNNTDPNKFIE